MGEAVPRRLALAVAFLLAPALGAQSAPTARVNAYIASAVRAWHEPGLAIAVVKDDKVVFAKGYGLRKRGEAAPVDENTVFAIGSLTKAFTAAAAGMLVDEGKLHWDGRVIDYLPDFRLYDPWVTREIRLRDLLCHRSGLPAQGGDLMAFGSTYGRDDLLRRVRFLHPASSFRSAYAYQNLMFVAAGQVVADAAGMSWDNFAATRIFAPLGMDSTSTSVSKLASGGDIAMPHIYVEGESRAAGHENVDNIGPAGAVNTSVRDMARWIRLQLGAGTFEGRKLFSSAVSREMWQVQTPIHTMPAAGGEEEPLFHGYGLGWRIGDYHGRKIVGHAGGLAGMTSYLLLSPGERFGLVILTNGEFPIQTPLAKYVLDAWLGYPERDWSAGALARFRAEERKDAASRAALDARRPVSAAGTPPLANLAGTYRSEAFGDMELRAENGKLAVRMVPLPRLKGVAVPWQYSTFLVTWKDPTCPRTFLTFTLDPDGKPTGASLRRAEEGDESFDFENYAFSPLR